VTMTTRTRTIDLGWDVVVLERLSETEWLMEPVGRKYRLENSRGNQWDVYQRPGEHHRGTFHTLESAVEAALEEALINAGESARSVGARRAAATKRARRKAMHDSMTKVIKEKLDEVEEKRKPGEIIREGRKHAKWNF
jgi:hypothetical protein